jgi:hypothetical protein
MAVDNVVAFVYSYIYKVCALWVDIMVVAIGY